MRERHQCHGVEEGPHRHRRRNGRGLQRLQAPVRRLQPRRLSHGPGRLRRHGQAHHQSHPVRQPARARRGPGARHEGGRGGREPVARAAGCGLQLQDHDRQGPEDVEGRLHARRPGEDLTQGCAPRAGTGRAPRCADARDEPVDPIAAGRLPAGAHGHGQLIVHRVLRNMAGLPTRK